MKTERVGEDGELGVVRRWWVSLSARQQTGVILYAAATLAMLGSLPLRFLDLPMGQLAITWRLLIDVGGMLVTETELWFVDSWRAFIRGPLPASSLMVSYLFIIPGSFLIFLGSRNRWACWVGRLLWSVLWLVGPPLFYLVVKDVGPGCVLWMIALTLFVVAHWLMAPRPTRLHPSGGLTSSSS